MNRSYFAVALLVCLGWAVSTQHVWEDYYITYRASKNLATGHGLTFTAGERVHSFTSPFGVLLPAAASLLTGNRSDEAALWIFRTMAAMALAGAVCLAGAFARRGPAAGSWAATLVACLILTDAKTLDFTVNGMETPFLLLFMAWMLWALGAEPKQRWRHLGAAWAGMMWTRPDAFIYIGGLALGALLFKPGSWAERGALTGVFFRAGLLTTALFLPWLVWAWSYYGTPVPHTVIAKGLFMPKSTPGQLLEWLVVLPGRMWADPTILAGTFMPAYSHTTGWSVAAGRVSAVLAVLAMLLWVLPRLRWEARVASFGALVGQYYLHAFVQFPIPWYLPAVTFLSLLALGLGLGQLAGRGPSLRGVAVGMGAALVSAASVLSLAAAWQLHWQQKLIEDGLRRPLGEWLGAQASSPRDTVFLEPLGYIGFFSGLKMLDYPGLGSPEVVAARRRAKSQSYPFCWSELIEDLQPDWLVLRPHELDTIRRRDAEVLERFYEPAQVFDAHAAVAAVRFLPGRGYLEGDARFEVFRRKESLPARMGFQRIKQAQLTRRDSWGEPAYDSGLKLLAHAPSLIEFGVPAGARWLSGGFGLLEGAYASPTDHTDGAGFRITQVSVTGARTVLLERRLDPARESRDQGTQRFRVGLPADGGHLELQIDPGPSGSNAFDWTYWAELILESPQDWR